MFIRTWIAMSIRPASINLFGSKDPEVLALFEKYRNSLMFLIFLLLNLQGLLCGRLV